VHGILREDVSVKYGRIKEWRKDYPVAALCRVLKVSESGYYAWVARPPSPRSRENARLEQEIKASHQRTRETYGPSRLQCDLADYGIFVGIDRIKRIRRKLGLRCKQKRKFKATTNSKHALPVAPNLLAREFTVSVPNQAWVSDITYIPTAEGWLYLAGIKDLFSGELVGYALNERMTKDLVIQALFRAVRNQKPKPGLILHSDRGSQYCAHDYQKVLVQFDMRPSMSRKGDCWDNSPMESFWGTLKNELVHHRQYSTRYQAKQEITEYIEIFYNRQRKQARLGFLSPVAFTKQYFNKMMNVA
jgi:putative transposase